MSLRRYQAATVSEGLVRNALVGSQGGNSAFLYGLPLLPSMSSGWVQTAQDHSSAGMLHALDDTLQSIPRSGIYRATKCRRKMSTRRSWGTRMPEIVLRLRISRSVSEHSWSRWGQRS